MLLGELHGLLAVAGLPHDVETAVTEHLDDVEADQRLVLGDDDAAGGAGGRELVRHDRQPSDVAAGPAPRPRWPPRRRRAVILDAAGAPRPAGLVESADTAHSKCAAERHAGSNPAPGTAPSSTTPSVSGAVHPADVRTGRHAVRRQQPSRTRASRTPCTPRPAPALHGLWGFATAPEACTTRAIPENGCTPTSRRPARGPAAPRCLTCMPGPDRRRRHPCGAPAWR